MAPPAEISIPSTILSTGESKPFTLYNITLRLPLRSFVVQKRYSDFASLHSSLTTHLQKQMMGEQDQQVEALGAIIRRQKEMGLQINEEIEATTDMLDRMNEDVDRVGGKVRVAKNRIKKL
ncbi:hypothetical protein VdG1_07712 [Verticillium dahliae VDG1]|nr:hypothetical protein VdG1_07712 [Verticillium dahliae VDG1]